MFENLTRRLSATVARLRDRGRLTEENIREALREVRVALLEADVALPVVQAFIERVKSRAVGQEVLKSLTPGQALIKVVRDELTAVMGSSHRGLELNVPPPAVVLLCGLQGSGKTTTAAKIAKLLSEQMRKRVLLASCDVRRPAAIEQLAQLATRISVPAFATDPTRDALANARAALDEARRSLRDVLIVDTAGRLAVDAEMMEEIRSLHAALKPAETLFVVDAMTGQDAAQTAKAFAQAVPLTGIVLSKADGDARGGAALSVRYVTGAPIKFLGTGERLEGLEPFHPDRMAGRILDMGDVLSLVEEVERKIDRDKAQQLAEKVVAGKRFDLGDFREQLRQMLGMGGIAGILDKLPGFAQIPEQLKGQVNDREIRRMIAIVDSMTPGERRRPEILNGSRKLRIARGSGTQPADVNRLLKQYQQVEKMMRKFGRGGLKGLLRGVPGLFGGPRR